MTIPGVSQVINTGFTRTRLPTHEEYVEWVLGLDMVNPFSDVVSTGSSMEFGPEPPTGTPSRFSMTTTYRVKGDLGFVDLFGRSWGGYFSHAGHPSLDSGYLGVLRHGVESAAKYNAIISNESYALMELAAIPGPTNLPGQTGMTRNGYTSQNGNTSSIAGHFRRLYYLLYWDFDLQRPVLMMPYKMQGPYMFDIVKDTWPVTPIT